MKAFFNQTALLLALLVAAFSQPISAQVGGTKPEFFLWRYNGAAVSPGPVVNGNSLGNIQWKGTVPSSKILIGADIQATCTGAPTATTLPARLGFRTGAPTLTERLTILENGNVGINTTSPIYRFHVEGNAFVSGDFNVGGNFNVAGSITAGLDVIAGRDVKAGRHVVAVENISGKNVAATELVSGKNMTATNLVSTKNLTATELVSTKNLIATENISTKNLTATELISTKNLNATELVSAKNLTATENISAGQNLFAANNITATETITGKNINALQDIIAGGSVTANILSGNTLLADNANISNNISAAGTITGNKICTQTQAIGTAGCNVPAGFRLAVGGGIIAEEVRVELQGAWPDYVFGEKYELPKLAELAEFLQNEKHLPGIPSALEMEKNGLDLGEMQRKTIEKVEELYLLTIQLNARISQLEAENAALQTGKAKGKGQKSKVSDGENGSF